MGSGRKKLTWTQIDTTYCHPYLASDELWELYIGENWVFLATMPNVLTKNFSYFTLFKVVTEVYLETWNTKNVKKPWDTDVVLSNDALMLKLVIEKYRKNCVEF